MQLFYEKTMAHDGGGDRKFFKYLLICSNKLIYPLLITFWFMEVVLPKVMNKVT